MPTPNKTWYVHGPQGCGKTLNSQAIAAALGVSKVVDEWNPGDRHPPVTDHLVLCIDPPEGFRRVMSFADAMKLVRAKHRGQRTTTTPNRPTP